MKKIPWLYLLAAIYFIAGVNHFVNPGVYYAIIPPYLGNVKLINIAAGIAEIALALMVLFKPTRYMACIGLILMLVCFIPTHIFMVHDYVCQNDYCPPRWVYWVRLILLQPLLIVWAWKMKRA